MRVLLLMDPFIKVPPDHYGGIERVVADLADRLTQRGHDVTLWAAPGSRVDGRVEPFGREGEWTRWSNVRNTLTLAGRFLRRPRRFDIIHNFGRLAYLDADVRARRRQGPDLHAHRRSRRTWRRRGGWARGGCTTRRSARRSPTPAAPAAATGR